MKVEKSQLNFVSSFNMDKFLEIHSLSKIMTGSSDSDLQSQESPSDIKENDLEASIKRPKTSVISPKIPNDMKSSKSKLTIEVNKKEINSIGTYEHLGSPNLKEITEVQSILEVEQPEDHNQLHPISNTNMTIPKSGTLTKDHIDRKNQKSNLSGEHENSDVMEAFDKMKAFSKFMPNFNYTNVIQKVNRQIRVLMKRKNGLKKKSDRKKNYKKSSESSTSLKKQSPCTSHRKFSIFKNDMKPLKSFQSKSSGKITKY